MIRRRLRRLGFIVATLVIVFSSLVFFREVVLTKIIELTLRASPAVPSDATVAIGRMQLSTSGFALVDLTVESEKDPCFHADVTLCQLTWGGRGIHSHIKGLRVHLPQKMDQRTGAGSPLRSLYNLGSVLAVDDGVVVFPGGKELSFRLAAQGSSRTLTVVDKQEIVSLDLQKHDGGIAATGRIADLDVKLLNRFMPAEWQLQSGKLLGKCSALLPKNDVLSQIEYTFSFKDVSMKVHEFDINANELSTHKEADAPLNHLFDGEWQVNRLSVAKSGSLILSDITGLLPTRVAEPIAIRGTLFCRGKTQPISIEGIRQVTEDFSETTIHIKAAAAAFHIESRYDNNFDGTAKIDCFKLDSSLFSHIPYEQVIPTEVGAVKVTAGNMSGGAYLRWHNGECDVLEVEQLSLKDFCCNTSAGKLCGKEGHLFFRYAHGDVPSWGLHAEDLSLPLHGITHFSGDFGLHERYVIPSTIEYTLYGTKVRTHLRGVLPELKVSVQAENGIGETLRHFFPDAMLQDESVQVLDSIALHTQLEFRQSTVNVTGTMHLGKDVASFGGAFLHPHVGKTDNPLELIESISFHGKNISSDLLNSVLALSGLPVKMTGKANIAGTIDRDECSIRFDKHTLSLASDVITLQTRKEQECGEVIYSLKDGSLKGAIPLKGYSIEISQADHLKFTDGSATISLNYPEIHISEIETSYENLHCGGHVVLVPDAQGIKLDLKTSFLDGTVNELEKLLKHFDDFKDTEFGVAGLVKQNQSTGLRLKAHIGEETTLAWAADLTVYNGSTSFGDLAHINNLNVDVSWDGATGDVSYSNVSGQLTSKYGGRPLQIKEGFCSFAGNIPVSFSCGLENSTHTVATLTGGFKKQNDLYALFLERPQSHFFSVPLENLTVKIDEACTLQHVEYEGSTSVSAFTNIIRVLKDIGASQTFEQIATPLSAHSTKGQIEAKVTFDAPSGYTYAKVATTAIAIDGKEKPNFESILSMSHDEIQKFSLRYGEISLDLVGKQDKETIRCKDIHIKRNEAFADITSFTLNTKKHVASIHLKKAFLLLDELKPLMSRIPEEYQEYLSGALTATGQINLDFTQGFGLPVMTGSLDFVAPRVGKGDFKITTKKPLLFRLGSDKKLTVQHGSFEISSVESEDHWAKISFDSIAYDHEKTTKIQGFQASLPPEMCLYIANTQSVPYVSARGKEVTILGVSVPWDNQVDVCGNCEFKDGQFSVDGSLKDGYYWLAGASTYLHNTTFKLDPESGFATTSLSIMDKPLKVTVESQHGSKSQAKCTLEDLRGKEERNGDSHTKLKIAFVKDQFGKLNLKSVQGGIYGVDISFQQQSHRTTVDVVTLSGKMRCHVPFLATVFPHSVQEVVSALGMGKGYEMSGDISLDWSDLKRSSFNGFIKGKNFELFNSRIQTLLGCVQINQDEVALTNLRISDEAGYFTINDLQLLRKNGSWQLSIPKVSLKDFRPSMLRKIGEERSKLKPLVVKELVFTDVKGDLADLKTITGKGGLYFENTFKKEYNIFDIPYELVARLGLDVGLLTPIRGRIDCVIDDGKIILTDMKNACSEGKRSKFYLSSTRPSYISLLGDINISIKMRQYVILKVTEPFILSIQGTVSKPTYSLR